MAAIRTYLVLGRVSNLSTVWSNIFCAWIIAGGTDWLALAGLVLGASLLYVAGMFMNDFFDAEFDAKHRPQRPVPSGAISKSTVKQATLILSLLGLATVAALGLFAFAVALGLLALIAAYNLTHKKTSLAPLLMGACRAALYPLAALAANPHRIESSIGIAAASMFLFICGITWLARSEATDNRLNVSALGLLAAAPALIVSYRPAIVELGQIIALSIFVLWSAHAFWRAHIAGKLIVGKTIGPLLAAIPLLDLQILLAFSTVDIAHVAAFLFFFAIAWAAQRVIPAS